MRENSNHNSHPSSAPGARPCVLVVDDDGASRKLLARALEQVGFDARQAADGEEALASIETKTPDVVLLDLQMPGLNGAEACRILRTHHVPAIRELPVIMLTAQDDEEAEVRCLEAGANDFLAKPVGRAALTARIQTQLRLHALTLELQLRNEELEQWRASQLADLEAAKLTQAAIIPARPPNVPRWKLGCFFQPFIQVGGDVYGWRRRRDGRCVLWMADATGHGAAAALVTTMVAHLFQQATHSSDEPDEILRDVNSEYFSVFHGKSFITAICAVLAPDGTVTFSSAAHPPILVARADGSIESFMAGATMIGLAENLAAQKTTIQLEPGEHLLVFTDGLYSFRNPSGEHMNWEAVSTALASADPDTEVIAAVLERIKDAATDEPSDDDITAISARYFSAGPAAQ
jgi:phosphoserine phosphatase RsbU/P